MKLRCIAPSATIAAALFVALIAAVAGEEEVIPSNQDDNTEMQPVSEPPIKLVHVLNPGEREYLSPNLIGVQNIAMTYLPLSMNFINIIDAFREVVNGVRYEILLNAVNTKENDADIICRLVILEKPWLRTEWGDKVRELQYSNCTTNEDTDNFTDPIAKNRKLNDKYEGNTLFTGGTRNELSADEMAKLDAQVLPLSDNSGRTATPKTTTTTTTENNVAAQEENADVSRKDDTARQATPVYTTNANNGDVGGTTAMDDVTADPLSATEPSELSDDEKKWLDDFLSVSAISFENSRQTTFNKNNAYNEYNENDNQNAGNDGDNNYVRVQKATNNEQQQYDESQDFQQEAEPDTEQYEPVHIRAKRNYNSIPGGVVEIDKDEAKELILHSFEKLAADNGENDFPNYRIGEIFSAKRQIVSGTIITLDLELIDKDGKSQRCKAEVWSQPWLQNGNEVTVDCPGQKKWKNRHSRSVENVQKKTQKKHNSNNYDKTEHLFHKFQRKYNKQYPNSMEYAVRLRVFKENLKLIEELNRNEQGSAKYGLTKFADLTTEEFKSYTGLWQREANNPTGHDLAKIPEIELPKEFDWREKGAVSEVKNQGSCGSCWAFSVTGNIEGLHAAKTGKLEEYSEQELLDCDTLDSACGGGLMDNAYKAIQNIGGLELESEYPYEGRKDQCHFDKSKVHVKVKGAVDLPKNETAMAQWLVANGPISIGINAKAMQLYRGGISHPWGPLCSKSDLDHGVLIVGFGVSEYPMFNKTLPYWIVKNSWGKRWGEQGYYRVYRGDNTCGVSEMATSAILE